MPIRGERAPAALSPLRTVALAIGFVCAISASVALFITDNPEYLRIAILVALWGFVFAALAAGRRQTEQVLAASTEIEVRRSYELELEREVAARREYELRLEAQLRRELQNEFAAHVGLLHEEMSGLRRELSEQWDSELRVERMVMRTQSVRMGADRREALEREPAGRASIEAAVHDTGPFDRRRFDSGSYDSGSFDSGTPSRASAEAPATREFPAVPGAGPSLPTAPVPSPAAPASGFPTLLSPGPPQVQPDFQPWTPHEPEMPAQATAAAATGNGAPDDVLTRILAEAGGTVRTRRKHRYADEDEDAPPDIS